MSFIINPYRHAGGGATNGLLTGLVSYWKLDETTGTTAYDAHGSNDGTITGATINQTGIIDKCYDFDGSGDYVDLGDWFDGSNSDFSVSCWVELNDTSSTSYVAVGFDQASIIEPYWMLLHRSDEGGWTWQTDVGFPDGATRPSITTGASTSFEHIVLVRDATSGSISIWRNGTEYKDASYNPTFQADHILGRMYIGRLSYGTNLMNGKIDEVGLWTRVLTSDEVSDLYNSGSGLAYGDFTT